MSSEKLGSASGYVVRVKDLTSRFKPPEGVLALLSEPTMLKEPFFRLLNGSLDFGVTMNTEVAVRDKIWNNNSVGCRGGLDGDFWSRDRDRHGFGDLNGDVFVNLRMRTSRRSKSVNNPRDTILDSSSHRPYPK